MASPVQPLPLAEALSKITEAATAVSTADYGVTEKIARDAAADPDEASFMLMTAFTMVAQMALARGGDVRTTLTNLSQQSLDRAKFMSEVLDGIDDLPGDPQGDTFHDR
jgi:hypothetical protein